jgi:2-oxoacid:acceptor oxidoreductase gamma subunit (pyruvate/2-ketoisovalerate family)
MLAIRVHGRGGQGGVIASKLLAAALFREGWQVQAFPAFGAERTGAPVAAFLRADDRRITIHSQIYDPDHVIVLDASLLASMDVTAGLKPGGWVLVNSARPPEDLRLPRTFGIGTCDATAAALAHGLGSRTRPIVNTAMVGGFVALTGILSLDSVLAEIPQLVPLHAEQNLAAAAAAFAAIRRLPARGAAEPVGAR